MACTLPKIKYASKQQLLCSVFLRPAQAHILTERNKPNGKDTSPYGKCIANDIILNGKLLSPGPLGIELEGQQDDCCKPCQLLSRANHKPLSHVGCLEQSLKSLLFLPVLLLME